MMHRGGIVWGVWLAAGALAALCAAATPPDRPADEALCRLVEADWDTQETRLGRTPGSAEAIEVALRRTANLLDDLGRLTDAQDLVFARARLEQLRRQAAQAASLDQGVRLQLYRQVRWLARQAALDGPFFPKVPLVFMMRRRFVCQMLHEYVAYFYDYGNVSGGGVYVLKDPGRSLETVDLTGGRLGEGNYTTLALSLDARTIYFAFAPRAAARHDYFSPHRRSFHIYAMDSDGGNLRQLTDGPFDDFDPCPLPDGGLAFLSTRRGGFTRCNNPWEPIPVYTLHRMDASGRNLRTISFHETNEWHPSVLNDGRIVYIRWDYVDRSAANYHGLWTVNPDGSGPSALFGNYTERINACYQPRAVPGSSKIVFVAGAHHADVGGSLVLLDPGRVRLDRRDGQDGFEAVEVLTPEVCFPESSGWPRSFFHSPWPLSENYYLVAFSHEPLPGMSSHAADSATGLYYFDRFGNLELLYRRDGISCMYPIPLMPRPVPPVVSGGLDPALGDEGEFILCDVRRSLLGLPEGRRVTRLRIFQVLPKTTPTVNQPRIGHANAEGARMLLGTVPLEADGSAYFRAPARRPIYFQAVDDAGRAVQTMRSVTYLQPGERRGCVGCHEPSRETPRPGPTMAVCRPPSRIEPGPPGTRPFCYPILVQPVLDRHCVRCHDGSKGADKSPLVLTGEPAGEFTRSYVNFRPYLRWYEWGGQSIAGAVSPPGRAGADSSPLAAIIDDQTHKPRLRLSAEDRERLLIWLDGNVPFYGTYGQAEQQLQRRGEAVPPPAIQ